jgi:hypothetical protein
MYDIFYLKSLSAVRSDKSKPYHEKDLYTNRFAIWAHYRH